MGNKISPTVVPKDKWPQIWLWAAVGCIGRDKQAVSTGACLPHHIQQWHFSAHSLSHSVSHPSKHGQKQIVLFVTYCQKVAHSLTYIRTPTSLKPRSSHHVGILSPHIITKRRLSAVQKEILRERETIFTFITVYCYDCSIFLLVIINHLLCLIYKLNYHSTNRIKQYI